MARRDVIRASDSDRETVAERLRRAAHDGRLTTEELEHRIGRALTARTYGELDRLTADLPFPRLSVVGAQKSTPIRHARAHPIAAAALVVLGIIALMIALAGLVIVSTAWIGWVVFAWIFFGRRRMLHASQRHHHGQLAGHHHRGYVSGSYTTRL